MLRRRLLMVATAALVLAGCEIGNPGPADRVAFPAPTMAKSLNDVAYGTEDQQVLDVYAPATPNGGAIIWLHGGGWADLDGATDTLASEEQAGMQPVVQAMYRRGWTVFSVRYSGTDEATFPKPLQDVKQAVRWVKVHASEFGVSPNSVVAMGFSAGGHLAAMLGVTAGTFEPAVPAALAGVTSKVAAVVSIAGVLDPATFPYRYGLPPGNASGVAALMGCPETPSKWATCNPLLLQQTRVTTFDDPSDAPIYIVQGARDGIVDPVTQGRNPYNSMVKTMGDDKVWFDLIDTGNAQSYAGLDPQNHSMALSYELNMTALADFTSRVLPATPVSPSLSRYSALTACRALDSRSANSAVTRPAAGTLRLQVSGRCNVPRGASAVVLTLTIVRPTAAGGLRAYAAGAAPLAPLLAYAPSEVRSTTAVVRLSASGAVDLTGISGSVLVDVSGVFVPTVISRSGRFAAVGANRVFDTAGTPLAAGTPVTIEATGGGVAPDASAVMVAIVVDDTSGPGHLAVAPFGTALPNFGVVTVDGAGQSRATYAIVELRNGRFTMASTIAANVTVDVVGWYTGGSAPVAQTGLLRAGWNVYV